MSAQTRYLHIDSADICYEVSGNPTGHPLIILHGGLGSMRDLENIYKYIPPHYMVVSVDLRGHGRSTLGSEPLSYARYQKDVEHLSTHLDIETYSVFGFSDGGIVGYRIAAADVGRVKRLITLGSQWRLEPDDPSIETLRSVTAAFWTESFPDDVARYNESNPQPNFDLLVENVRNVWLDTSTDGYPNASVARIACPTVIMRGDDDFLLSLHETQQLIEKLANPTFMNIPFTRHEAHKEYPEVVGSVVHRFLSQDKH